MFVISILYKLYSLGSTLFYHMLFITLLYRHSTL